MRACVFGDSFVHGYGDADRLGWLGRVAALARAGGNAVAFENYGIPGETSGDIAGRWAHEAARTDQRDVPRLAFSFGANDCVERDGAPRVAHERSVANAAAILRRARELGPTIVIGPIPVLDDAPTDERIAHLAAAQHALCGSLNIPFLPVFDFVAGCAVWRTEAAAVDGTHPNRGGYAALAEFIWTWPALHAWLT